MTGLDTILQQHRVIICAGSGGVGKTTTAAALALRAALTGRRTLVLTIDPAKRLANALGLEGLSKNGDLVTVDQVSPGTLSAMMLDQKGAWDAMVERHAPSATARERILSNRFYQHLSQSFAGSQEYMAIEQLCELHASDRYDLIVVDTPPTRHALDFLEAPARLADFLDRRVVKWFVKPYFSASSAMMRFVNRTTGFLVHRLEEAAGVSTLMEVSEFFAAMSGLFERFEPRVRSVYALLRSPETAFVLVTSAEEQVLREAETFRQKVLELRMTLCAVVFNRLHRVAGDPLTAGARRDISSVVARLCGTGKLATQVRENFYRYETLGQGDSHRMRAFRRVLGSGIIVAEVPNFTSDVHNLAGLRSMHTFLFPS